MTPAPGADEEAPVAGPARTRIGAYLKTAFTNRWNLLCFLGAMGFAMLSGRPDIFAPLVLAGEVLYVGGLASHPRFQAYVEAQAAKALRQTQQVDPNQLLARVLARLPAQSLERFDALRARCLDLRQIAMEIKDPARAGTPLPLDALQTAGLDRLLWIYLRLLFTEHSLERFLQRTRAEQIEKDIADLEARIRKTEKDPDEQRRQKTQRTLEDNLQTCRDRLANYQKARDNYEFVQLEINRLENKIRALSELAVNRHEPDFITTQVDQVAESMLHTERTMNELQFVTGLEAADDAVPELLHRQTLTTR